MRCRNYSSQNLTIHLIIDDSLFLRILKKTKYHEKHYLLNLSKIGRRYNNCFRYWLFLDLLYSHSFPTVFFLNFKVALGYFSSRYTSSVSENCNSTYQLTFLWSLFCYFSSLILIIRKTDEFSQLPMKYKCLEITVIVRISKDIMVLSSVMQELM